MMNGKMFHLKPDEILDDDGEKSEVDLLKLQALLRRFYRLC